MVQRIVLILPCCIGDVVLATATLAGLRRAYPNAHIAWAVGTWSASILRGHPHLDSLLDTGDAALPVKTWAGFWKFRALLAKGRFDAAVSLVRSPLMGLAVWAAGIPTRVGLNSNGRGILYNVRADLDPDAPQHEADIYLSTLQAWGIDTRDCLPFIPTTDEDRILVRRSLTRRGIGNRYLVVNPTGGSNPGMTMDSKRYPPQKMARLAQQLSEAYAMPLVLVGGPKDTDIVNAVQTHLDRSAVSFVGEFSVHQLGVLARESYFYLGNDTGMTHLASACGARTIMIMGPSDPLRYAPYGGQSLTLWKRTPVSLRGVAGAQPVWDWEQQGISVEDAYEQVRGWVG
jgi:ADP-heptose:LPS heptosyltransferase